MAGFSSAAASGTSDSEQSVVYVGIRQVSWPWRSAARGIYVKRTQQMRSSRTNGKLLAIGLQKLATLESRSWTGPELSTVREHRAQAGTPAHLAQRRGETAGNTAFARHGTARWQKLRSRAIVQAQIQESVCCNCAKCS